MPGELPAALVETHTAVVVFAGDRAYKIKKPVSLGFLDFSTVAARQSACAREVELNRRLAPDVYLGVAEVRDPSGEACEYVVVMRRMPSDRRLTACLERGEDVTDALRRVAHQVASLHASSDPGLAPEGAGGLDALRQRWADNFDVVRSSAGALFDEAVVARIELLVRRYLAGRAPLFARRVEAGRVRDGHGDLQADDIFLLDDGPRVLDCLEFDDGLRWDDVLDDVAFLAMDLERLGHEDLARRFVAWHRELSADAWPRSLADHYIAYRAHIRAKVTAIRHAQGDEHAGAAARGLLELSRRHLEAARVRLVLVGGLPGTGKSTLSAAAGDVLACPVLRSDVLRAPGDGHRAAYGEGRYRPESVAATYATMLDEARSLLQLGESVILDASWSSGAMRAAAREVADATSSDLVELRCDAPADVAAARLDERAARGEDASEATPAIAATMASHFDPWPEATVVDTAGSVTTSTDAALRAILDLDPGSISGSPWPL